MARRDFYAVLGVKRDAGPDDVKRAYRNLARRYHPDKNAGDEEAARRFREIAEAYETLSDVDLRTRYDRLGPLYRTDGRPPTPDEVGEWVSDTLGGIFRKRRPEQGEDLRYTLSVNLETVSTGSQRDIEVRRQVRCGTCNGNGADPSGGVQTCTPCNGTGRAGGRRIFRTQCPLCNGTGQTVIKPCSTCAGQGRSDLNDALKVRIPKGVATGQKLKLRAKGNDPRTPGETGDLYVIVNVEEHPFFRRRGADLFCQIPIGFEQAALGDDVAVPTIEGQTTIRIPSGTPSGKVFRLAGRGLPTMKGTRRGDLHLEMMVEIPATLSTPQEKAIKELGETLDLDSQPQRKAFAQSMKGRNP